MVKLGWISDARNSKEKAINLRKYFGVVDLSLLENKQITRIACRRLAITEKSDFALLAWAQKAKIEARTIETSPINLKELISIVPEIRNMTVLKPQVFCPKIKNMLAECGIALVLLPHLKGSFLQGASFMDGNKIVVGLTARGKDADRFWFSLFHELAHIVLGHVGQLDGTTNQDEKEADAWARDMLMPKEDFDKFVATGIFSTSSVQAFANRIGIAPGIVVGRLQNEGYIKYSMMNDLKEQYEIV